MKKIRIRLRIKIYPVLWSIISLASVYLLARFAMLSFSEDMGQAGLFDAVVSKLCYKVMGSGSSLVSYTSKEDGTAYAFPLNLVKDELALGEFTEDDTSVVSGSKDYSTLFASSANASEEVFHSSSEKVTDYLGVYEIESDFMGLEYILTNGSVMRSDAAGMLLGKAELLSHQLQIGYLQGEISRKESQEEGSLSNDAAVETATSGKATQYTLEQLKDINFLVNNFYIVDPSTKITDSLFDGEKLVGKDMTIKQTSDAPQILIYHTHSQEGYINSRPGKVEDTVVGVGSYLMKILEEDYGYNVIHDTSEYDLVNGVLDRDVAYNQAKAGITKILEKNPTIEVVIDLHRDSPAARNTVVNGKETAQIMLFNGLSRDQKGPITYLDNPSLQDNLAFSLQLQLKSKEKYPGLFFKNYLKCYRYNLHVRPKSILIELGTEQNTLESAMNAMDPFAEILDSVLQGK